MECRCVGSNCLERKGDSSFLIVLLSGVKQQLDPVAKEKPREPGSSNGLQPDSSWPEQDELGSFIDSRLTTYLMSSYGPGFL